MNYLDLFSGVGGFALGAYWAGMKFENHFFSDIEKYPVKLYQKRFPDAIALGDITKIDWQGLKDKYPGIWIITGGFPCQDISVAGKGRGMIDEKGNKTRSGLWFKMWNSIRILQPRFAIIENVGVLVNRGLDTVLSNLAEIGYNAEWQDIRAEDMGAPHKRERIWIIAYPASINDGYTNKKRRTSFKFRDCAWGDFATERKEKIKSCFLRVDDGLPEDVDRLKGLGNSIVPQIAQLLFEQIKPYIQETKNDKS